MKKRRILLHICCAPDATTGFERLAPEGDLEGFFYNPNIHPPEEYQRRLQAMHRLSEATGAVFREGPNDPGRWYEAVQGLEDEPEKGKRCEACIRLRLQATARLARAEGFDAFAAVLSVSPRKDAAMVNRIGQEAAEEHHVQYMPTDLKKKDGFKRSVEICRELGIYRQNYCGCEFSFRPPKGEGGGG